MRSREAVRLAKALALLTLMLMGAAPAAQSPIAGGGTQLPVEVQLVEQTACLIDPESFLVSFQLRTTYSGVGGDTLALVPGSERVTRLLVARDETSLANGSDVRVFAGAAASKSVDAPGADHAMTRPGGVVSGRVLTWLPVSIADREDEGALAPGDYVVRLTIDVAGVGPPATGNANRAAPTTAWYQAVTPPLAIHIPAPRQEQECGSAASPLRLVIQSGL